MKTNLLAGGRKHEKHKIRDLPSYLEATLFESILTTLLRAWNLTSPHKRSNDHIVPINKNTP